MASLPFLLVAPMKRSSMSAHLPARNCRPISSCSLTSLGPRTRSPFFALIEAGGGLPFSETCYQRASTSFHCAILARRGSHKKPGEATSSRSSSIFIQSLSPHVPRKNSPRSPIYPCFSASGPSEHLNAKSPRSPMTGSNLCFGRLTRPLW